MTLSPFGPETDAERFPATKRERSARLQRITDAGGEADEDGALEFARELDMLMLHCLTTQRKSALIHRDAGGYGTPQEPVEMEAAG